MTNIYDPESGYFVSERHQYVASIVKDYNPDLHVAWIPPDKRETNEEKAKPFAIVHAKPGEQPYMVMLLSESEMDGRVLDRLFIADQAKNDPLAALNAANARAKLIQAYEAAAQQEQLADIHATILRSPLHTFKHDGKVYS